MVYEPLPEIACIQEESGTLLDGFSHYFSTSLDHHSTNDPYLQREKDRPCLITVQVVRQNVRNPVLSFSDQTGNGQYKYWTEIFLSSPVKGFSIRIPPRSMKLFALILEDPGKTRFSWRNF